MPEVSVRGRRLAYEVQPVGLDKSSLTVVFIHGSGGDREDWRAQLDGLPQIANVIALELPGHGESDPPGEATVEAYAQWVADFVDVMGLQTVMLVGCSLGSAITQWIALFSPKTWLVGIGLVGAGARLRVHPAFLEGLRQDKQKALAMLSDFCLSPATGEPLRERLREKYLKTSAELVHGDLSACNEFDVMDSIHKLRLPTWILVGEDDQLTPVKYARYLHEVIAGSRLGVVPQAGHLVMMERPEEFNRLLAEFLTELDG
jgi:pimeloyl-ACP methyl ester carboxylesterase